MHQWEYCIKNSLDSNSLENATGAGNGHQKKSTQHKGPATGDLEGDAKREKRGRETEQQGRRHIDNSSEKKMNREKERRGRNGGNCWGSGELLSGSCLRPQQRRPVAAELC